MLKSAGTRTSTADRNNSERETKQAYMSDFPSAKQLNIGERRPTKRHRGRKRDTHGMFHYKTCGVFLLNGGKMEQSKIVRFRIPLVLNRKVNRGAMVLGVAKPDLMRIALARGLAGMLPADNKGGQTAAQPTTPRGDHVQSS